MVRLEAVGAVNKGRGYIEIPGEHPLPEIVRRHQFRARKVFWQEIGDVSSEELKTATAQLGKAIPQFKEWTNFFDHNGGNLKWHFLIIHGRDVRRSAGFKRWILCLLVPPPFTFDTGEFRCAYLRDSNDARTFVLTGSIIPNAIAKSFKSWEEFQDEKRKLHPGLVWNAETIKTFKRQWKETNGRRPWRFYAVWVPGHISATELRAVDGMKIAIAATALQASQNAADAAKAKTLEATVHAQEKQLESLGQHVMDVNIKLGDATTRNEKLETELNLTRTSPVVHAEPNPVAFAVPSLLSESKESKKKPEPGWFMSILWILILVFGFGLVGAGSPWGVIPMIFAGLMLYLHYGRETKKKELEKLGEAAAKETADTVGEAAEKLKQLGAKPQS